jgi:hypothetical protein
MARQDHLREWAIHMLGLAAKTDDRQFADWLLIRARQYLREAQALEASTPESAKEKWGRLEGSAVQKANVGVCGPGPCQHLSNSMKARNGS